MYLYRESERTSFQIEQSVDEPQNRGTNRQGFGVDSIETPLESDP